MRHLICNEKNRMLQNQKTHVSLLTMMKNLMTHKPNQTSTRALCCCMCDYNDTDTASGFVLSV